jgi:hypothetical protein
VETITRIRGLAGRITSVFIATVVVLLLIFFLHILQGCGDEIHIIDSGAPPTFEDFVHFDTSRYNVMLLSEVGQELYYDGEYIIGEPFTDNNGNGIYDPGIDGFIKCVCDSNQDLNHNGQYDGPDDPWFPGTPFDDINGDSIYQYPNWQYDAGELFADIDLDSTFDYSVGGQVTKCRAIEINQDTVRYKFHYRDSCWLFTSDSGVNYFVPPRSTSWWNPIENDYRALLRPIFSTTPTGLLFLDTGLLRITVLDTGRIDGGDTRVIAEYYGTWDSITFMRSVTLDTIVSFAGQTASRALLVRFSEPQQLDGTPLPYYGKMFYEFYFTRDDGFIGFIGATMSTYPTRYAFTVSRNDTIPLSLIR